MVSSLFAEKRYTHILADHSKCKFMVSLSAQGFAVCDPFLHVFQSFLAMDSNEILFDNLQGLCLHPTSIIPQMSLRGLYIKINIAAIVVVISTFFHASVSSVILSLCPCPYTRSQISWSIGKKSKAGVSQPFPSAKYLPTKVGRTTVENSDSASLGRAIRESLCVVLIRV